MFGRGDEAAQRLGLLAQATGASLVQLGDEGRL